MMRTSLRWRHALGAGVLGLLAMAWLLPAAPAGASSPSVRIRLLITGGYTYSGTLTGREDPRVGSLCNVTRAAPGHIYNVTYGADARFLLGRPTHDGFMLQVQGYKPETGRYSSTRETLIVVVHKHSYYTEGILRTPSKLTVRINRNERSGTFEARQLAPTPGFRSRPVRVRGSWSCGFVHQR